MNKQSNYFEIVVGTFVLLCALFFFYNSVKSANVKTADGYHVIAKFDNIDGIANGSDVKIAGVKIGTVADQYLDEKDYRAVLKISLNPEVKLPSDSSAKIASEGLLGSRYLAINPGSEEEILKANDEIQFTQSSVNLEDLLGKFIFNSNNKTETKKDETSVEQKK